MAVSGACSTPAIMPHNPARTELPMGMVVGSTKPLRPKAKAKPTSAPLNKAGAKMPATPPAPTVNPVSMGFKHAAKTKRCFVCAENTGGIFNAAKVLQEKISRQRAYDEVEEGGEQTDEALLAEYEEQKKKARGYTGGWGLA